MPSEELRKKWGTIFMGDREATMEQLDAMQEPVLRDRKQKDKQQEYLERVRKRAADRAREILGEAYAERQKVLAEAEASVRAEREKLHAEIEAIRAEAATLRREAQAELERAREVGREADEIRAKAHDEGYQVGVDAAGQELREFRADMGNELAQIMRAIERQYEYIADAWKNDLCELVRVAVQAGTGYVLDTHLEAVLNSLVLQSINLLEQREVISFRVNPEDEAIVNDLFRAAREKAPEIKQWIVTPDEMVDRGGLLAESGSGSVDLRRKNFEELVGSLLEHLALPVTEQEKTAAQELHKQVEERAVAFSQSVELAPDASEAPVPEASVQEASVNGAPVNGASLNEKDILFGKADLPPKESGDVSPAGASPKEVSPEDVVQGVAQEALHEPAGLSREAQESRESLESGEQGAHDRNEDLPPLPEDVFEMDETPPAQKPRRAEELTYSEGPEDALPENTENTQMSEELLGRSGMPPLAPPPPKTQPEPMASLADLEEELFPVNQDEEHTVLQKGGFLPET